LNHIEKLKSLKHIDDSHIQHLKSMVAKQDFDIIYAELKKSTDGKLKPVYDLFNGKYSFVSIQVVRLFVR